MAKGKEAYEARVAELNLFGKDLARRAKLRCELCERGGETLSIVEVPPAPKDPEFKKCVMLCESGGRAKAVSPRRAMEISCSVSLERTACRAGAGGQIAETHGGFAGMGA